LRADEFLGGEGIGNFSHDVSALTGKRNMHDMLVADRLDQVGDGVDSGNAAGQDEGNAITEPLRLFDIVGGE